MNQQTQTLPAEYVPVLQMTQKESAIRQGITSLKKKILVSAGEEFQSWDEEKQERFLEGVIMAIAKDEKLTPCFESPEGKLSIIEAVEKTVSTGLKINGIHAYLVPQKRSVIKNGKKEWITEARFSIKADGYYALLCGGKKPIFKDMKWGIVREGDDCIVKNGKVEYSPKITAKLEKVIGCFVEAEKINGCKDAKFFQLEQIHKWRDCSYAYQNAIKNKDNDTPWILWHDEMCEQSSIRHFSDRYERAHELLASALYDDDREPVEEKTTVDIIDETLDKSEQDIPDIERKAPVEKKETWKGSEEEKELF